MPERRENCFAFTYGRRRQEIEDSFLPVDIPLAGPVQLGKYVERIVSLYLAVAVTVVGGDS